jgi:hypothetical protein
MGIERILLIILAVVLHLVLAGMLLEDLSNRKRVLGRRKVPWVITISLIVFVGSLLYLLCHPGIFYSRNDE